MAKARNRVKERNEKEVKRRVEGMEWERKEEKWRERERRGEKMMERWRWKVKWLRIDKELKTSKKTRKRRKQRRRKRRKKKSLGTGREREEQ